MLPEKNPGRAKGGVEGSKVIECYGSFHARRESCRQCVYAEYCRTATEDDAAAISPSGMVDFAAVEFSEEVVLAAASSVQPSVRRPEFTREDLLEVISFMVCMDSDTLGILDAKINDPTISFATMARQRNISRQAIHQLILKKCQEMPELAPVIHNRQNKLRQGGTNSFMEAVWEIRQQTSGRKSKKPNGGSKFSGTLTSLTRNLDLSRLSIYSGGRNYISD